MSYLADYSKKAKDKLSNTNASTAKEYLLKHGFISSSFTLPEFYEASGFEHMNLLPLWSVRRSRTEMPKITIPLDIYSPKGNLGWRRFNILHPYIYWHTANELTDETTWEIVKRKLTQETNIACYSTPEIPSEEKIQGHGVKAWLRFAETDLLRDAGDYSHLLVTDISNFYPSVYTHSIAWALDGKEILREPQNRFDYSLRGNRLDKLFQNGRDGKTNGIPIGTAVSDIIAECVLVDIDREISDALANEPINFVGARYRDDYRFLCRSYSEAQSILKKLNRILHDKYDLSLNGDKTAIYEDIVENSIRPWAKEIRQNALFLQIEQTYDDTVKGRDLRHALLAIYDIQKANPAGRPANSMLPKITKYLRRNSLKKLTIEDVHFSIAILRRLSKLREETTPYVMITIDLLMEPFSNLEKLRMLDGMYVSFLGDKDNDFQEIWLHRLTQHHIPLKVLDYFGKTENPILQMVMGAYEFDYKMFEEVDLKAEDMEQMKKFTFVNRSKQKEAVDTPINEKGISIFGYYNEKD
jgi:hypothetical protein